MSMKYIVHHHHYNLKEISADILSDIRKEFRKLKEQIMATLADFQAALAAVDAETTRIGVLIQDLLDRLNKPGLSEDEENVILAQLAAAGERLKSVGSDVNNPVPPPA